MGKKLKKRLRGHGPVLVPAVLPEDLVPFGRPDGAGVFGVKFEDTRASPDDPIKIEDLVNFDEATLVELFVRTGNPVWLWISMVSASSSSEFSVVAFVYLKRVAISFLATHLSHYSSLEKVKIVGGADLEEAFVPLKHSKTRPPSISEIFGLYRPGQNAFQAAARDQRNLNISDLIDNKVAEGYTREDVYALLATVTGRVSEDSGPSISAIRQFDIQGRKLRKPRRKP